jgi:methionyl-tRNA formyltransferase
MCSRIDAGDILQQVEVPISPLDTAFTLNVKCYEAGIAAFDLLLCDLAAGTPSGVAQDLSHRTFFGPAEIPGPPRLRWQQPAQRISQLIRALDLGPGRAVLASPSVLTPSGADVTVRTVTVLPEASGLPPGTVVSIGPGRFTVTTGSEDLALGGIRDAEGRRVDAIALWEEFGIDEGVALPAYREE